MSLDFATPRTEPKPPPENPAAEASLLGSILLDAGVFGPHVRGKISSADLTRSAHRSILAAIEHLDDSGEPIAITTVREELHRRGQLDEVGGAQFLVGLLQSVPTVAHAETYAGIVQRTALLRRLIAAANEIYRLALISESADDALRDAQAIVFALSEASLRHDAVPLRVALNDFAEQITSRADQKVSGVPTGLKTLDEKTGGLQPSDLIVLAGRPSLGKTTLALNIVEHAALKHAKTCAVFSLEMSDINLAQKFISMVSEIDNGRMRHGRLSQNEFQAISYASNELQRGAIYLEDTSRLSVTDILAQCRRLQAERGLDLVVVDYLQLIQGRSDAENRVQEVAQITRSLKAIARELQVPIIALSQLSRQIETRGTEPMLSDLRDSGSIEQDADLVLFLWKDKADKEDQVVRLKLAKHRNGPTAEIDLHFRGEISTFRDLGEARATA